LGKIDLKDTDEEDKKFRVETFNLKSDEELIGFEIYTERDNAEGIRWMTWRRPVVEQQLALPIPRECCTCLNSDATKNKACTLCGKNKVEDGVTCDHGDKLLGRFSGD